jgi:hypothetical protein
MVAQAALESEDLPVSQRTGTRDHRPLGPRYMSGDATTWGKKRVKRVRSVGSAGGVAVLMGAGVALGVLFAVAVAAGSAVPERCSLPYASELSFVTAPSHTR